MMVFRKAYNTINRVGQAWMNFNQGIYNSPAKTTQSSAYRRRAQAQLLLAEVVADWPASLPDTPAVTAARDYLRRAASDS